MLYGGLQAGLYVRCTTPGTGSCPALDVSSFDSMVAWPLIEWLKKARQVVLYHLQAQ